MARVRTHPGEVLREEFLAPLGMSAHQLADAIDVPPNRISEIARENRSVTADTALRLAEYFKTTAEFWMNLQSAHDLSKARAEAEDAAATEHKQRNLSARIEQQMTGGWAKRSSGEFTRHSASKMSSHGAKGLAASTLTNREQRGTMPSKGGRNEVPSKKK